MRAWNLILLSLIVGCANYGSRTLPKDRYDYSRAVARSWKEQMLLNIVKLRYLDTPVFVEVQQIIAGYTLEGSANVGWSEAGVAEGLALGAGGSYSVRPTITYRPLTGTEFAKNLLQPIPPHGILFLIQAGYPADLVMPLCVHSINGLRNESGPAFARRPPDDGFRELVEQLTLIQRHGALGMRVERGEKEMEATVLTFPMEDPDPEVAQAVRRVRELLKLDEGRNAFKVAYATGPGGGDSIMMLSRSALHIMIELALEVEVPQAHADQGWTVPVGREEVDDKPLIRIQSADKKPGPHFVGVDYEDHWFWIGNDDLFSKRTFTFLRLIFSFAETGSKPIPTLVTVPTG